MFKHSRRFYRCFANGCNAPIAMHFANGDISMKRGVWPCDNAIGQSMFDWIVMNVLDMRMQIFIIAKRVFPEAPGPQ